MNNNKDFQEWQYSQDADITFGEVHENKLPKIILICTLIGIVVLSTAAVIFRKHIYDFINNPQLTFDTSVVKFDNETGTYSVDAEISNVKFFDPNKYISTRFDDNGEKDFSNLEYTYEIDDSKLDLTKVGSYELIYTSHNRIFSAQNVLTVNLRDKTPPIIKLKLSEKEDKHVELDDTGAYRLSLTRNKDTNTFEPMAYIDSVTDNYTTDENKIVIECIKPTQAALNTEHIINIIYSATDEAGNVGTVNLRLEISDDIDQIKKEQEEQLKQAEEEKRKLEEEKEQLQKEKEELQEKDNDNQNGDNGNNNNDNGNGNNGGNNNNGGGNNSGNGGSNNSGGGQASYDPPPEQHYEPPSISAGDVTVSLAECGGDENVIAQKCIAAVSYRGSTGSAMPSGLPGFDVPLAVGVYTITWTTTDGLSCTQTLTITE